jgi:hypothetical protein
MSQLLLVIFALLFSIVYFVAATDYIYDGGFDRDTCYARTKDLIGAGKLFLNDSVFSQSPKYKPMGLENLTLTLPGCEQICGKKQAWYWDIGPRLSTWLIPILLLVSNVELSPLDKRRFMAIIHLLGDPIDSFWSLIHKIFSWDWCYTIAGKYEPHSEHRRRIVATVFAGFEEIQGDRIESREDFEALAKRSGLVDQEEMPDLSREESSGLVQKEMSDLAQEVVSESDKEDKFYEWTRAAWELADNRTDEFFRTCLAILLYIYQVIASFVPEIGGGNTSPPGGRIGTALFISWLVPAVLLSNTIGGFTSRRSCFDIICRFMERTNNPLPPPLPRQSVFFGHSSNTEYFQSLPWSASIPTFRPWKTRNTSSQRPWSKTVIMFILSVLPICISLIGGFIIIWNTLPNGFNCRHFWLIGIFTTWCISALITRISNSPSFLTGKYHWRFVLIKDFIVALSSMVVIFLSSSGVFNSCFCWSGYFYYGRKNAFLPLNSDPFYEKNDRTIYPAIVGVTLILHFCTFGAIAVFGRKGLKLMRWSEMERHEEFKRVRAYEMQRAIRKDQRIKLEMVRANREREISSMEAETTGHDRGTKP